MQTDILTVTLNPALDLASEVESVVPGPKLRCAMPQVDPGGGGINVARAVARLGGQARAFVALGGTTGMRITTLLRAEGVEPVVFDLPGETRHSLAVTDRTTGEQFRFVLPGPDWTAEMAARATDAIAAAASAGGVVVLSGSQPPGVGPGFPGDLARALARRGDVRLIVDTSGPALAALGAGPAATGAPVPDILRMDGEEAEELAGRALPGRADSAAFAAGLVARGAARCVIVARGADGSVMAEGGGCWHVAAADVEVRSKIGAGDSFVGALAWALIGGAAPPDALQWGAAAASAAVTTDATRLFDPDTARGLRAACTLTRL